MAKRPLTAMSSDVLRIWVAWTRRDVGGPARLRYSAPLATLLDSDQFENLVRFSESPIAATQFGGRGPKTRGGALFRSCSG